MAAFFALADFLSTGSVAGIDRPSRWGVGIRQRAFQAFAAEDDDKAVFLAGLDQHFGVLDLLDFLGEHLAKLLAGRGGNAARAAVGDDPLGIQRAEIGARRDVARLQFPCPTPAPR